MRAPNLLPFFLIAGFGAAQLTAQTAKVWTVEELFRRTVGEREQTNKQFPPHKIIGNVYYVGTEALGSFLITTPAGHILINSSYEATVPVIRDSVEKLGFKFGDIKILLGSHAHGDHMQGDALVKELTGAQVMAMEQDVPALINMKPGNKPHPIDRVLHDGDEVSLGGSTLVARLTPGHTRGCTTWTMKALDGGKSYNVVIVGSVGINPGFKLVNNTDTPQIVEEFERSYKILRGLACDVPLGSHPAMYNLDQKYPQLGKGPNPFIDPVGYKAELDLREQVFRAELERQKKAAGQ
jgi:metallo-beta-lactamase class B